MREFLHQVAVVQANPRQIMPVPGELSVVIEAIRKVELANAPLPVNTAVEQMQAHAPIVISRFVADSPILTPEERPYGMEVGPFPWQDLGPTTAALAFNMPAIQNVPDVRRDRGLARGGR